MLFHLSKLLAVDSSARRVMWGADLSVTTQNECLVSRRGALQATHENIIALELEPPQRDREKITSLAATAIRKLPHVTATRPNIPKGKRSSNFKLLQLQCNSSEARK